MAVFHRYGFRDSLPEKALDELTGLVGQICETPFALIALLDADRQWFYARVGFDAPEPPRDVSFTVQALSGTDLLIVPDASQDARFAENPLVTGDPKVRFYAGAPLITPEGEGIGTLCVMDRVTRTLTPCQEQALRVMARQVMAHLELHRQKRELQASEQKQRAIFETSPDCVKLIRPDGTLLEINAAGLRLIEADRLETVIGQDLVPLIVPEERAAVRAMLQAAAAGEKRTTECRLVSLKGTPRRIELQSVPFHDQATGEDLVLCISHDVSARRQVEEKLRASEERMHAFMDNNPAASWIADWDGRFEYANPSFFRSFGHEPGSVVGRTIGEIYEPIFAEEYVKKNRIVMEQQRQLVTVDPGRLADGTVGQFLVVKFPIKGPGGKRLLGGIALDITERKRMEEALRVSEARFASVFRSNPAAAGITVLATGRVVDANDRLCDFFGQPREEMIGRTIMELGAWANPEQREPLLRQVQTTGSARDAEVQMRGRNGELRDVLVSLERVNVPGETEPMLVTMFIDVTERKRAEAQLRLLETCVERLNDIVIITEVDPLDEPGPRILFVNEAFVQHLGYSREEVLGRSPRFLQGPKTNQAELLRIRTAMGALKPVRAELINYKKDGGELWLEIEIVPVADRTGKYTHFVAVERDITERKQASEELQLSEARYRALFEYAPDGIVIADAQSYYIDANASACRMFGYAKEELIGLHASQIVAEKEIPQIEPALDVIHSRADHHREWRLRRKGGSDFPAEVIATMMPDGNLLGVIRDITERKRSDERFRRLIDSNAQGVIFFNTRGRVLDANDAFLKMTGYTREDLEAKRINWMMMTPPEYGALDDRAIAEMAQGGTCSPFEKEYLRKDGSRVPILLGAATFADAPDEGVCFVLDLTERKKLEQQSLRSQRMDSLGTLAGGIAHDLNNVLGPIVMSLDLLQLKFPDQESQELIAAISSSAQRGTDMVRQVLSFARGVEGRRMTVQIKQVLKDIEKITNDTFLKNIQIRTTAANGLWTVIGDPTQIHQVLLNLCVNARDAMPRGGALTISAENLVFDAHYAVMNPEAKPGPYICLQVQDNGTGMPPEIMERIFDPFFTTKEVDQGTGLGLSTSLAIVKSHGGFIRVESEPGSGTKFKVYLPAETEPSLSAEEEPVAELPRGHGELILVVDDEVAMRQVTKQTLEAFGYRAIVAADGTEAVGLFAVRKDEISVVLTDINMPGLDGPSTIKVLQRMSPAVRIVAASGLASSTQIARVTSLGVTQFLPKPYTAETLLKAIGKVLAEKE